MKKQVIKAILVDDETMFSRLEICQYLNISEDLLEEMEAQGLFDTCLPSKPLLEKGLNQKALIRMEKACRLHTHLGINLPGVVLALELLDELEALRNQIAILER